MVSIIFGGNKGVAGHSLGYCTRYNVQEGEGCKAVNKNREEPTGARVMMADKIKIGVCAREKKVNSSLFLFVSPFYPIVFAVASFDEMVIQHTFAFRVFLVKNSLYFDLFIHVALLSNISL